MKFDCENIAERSAENGWYGESDTHFIYIPWLHNQYVGQKWWNFTLPLMHCCLDTLMAFTESRQHDICRTQLMVESQAQKDVTKNRTEYSVSECSILVLQNNEQINNYNDCVEYCPDRPWQILETMKIRKKSWNTKPPAWWQRTNISNAVEVEP